MFVVIISEYEDLDGLNKHEMVFELHKCRNSFSCLDYFCKFMAIATYIINLSLYLHGIC